MKGGRKGGSFVWKHMTIPLEVQSCVRAMLAGERVITFASAAESEAWSAFYRAADRIADLYGQPRIGRLPVIDHGVHERARNVIVLYGSASPEDREALIAALAESP